MKTRQTQERETHDRRALILFSSWLLCLVAGFGFLGHYATRPGAGEEPPARWPARTQSVAQAPRPLLLVFLHPRCICSDASLEAVERLLLDHPAPIDVRFHFTLPANRDQGWAQGRLLERARRLPGARIHYDHEGREALRFGAHTSGSVVAYSGDGRRLFFGGLTRARGHAGDSAGSAAIRRALTRNEPSEARPPVFGCPLRDIPDVASTER